MTVTVLLFASYAEKLGKNSIGLEVASGCTVGQLLASVRSMPGAGGLPPQPLVAVNQTYAAEGTVLRDGDEVALIPPVAGG